MESKAYDIVILPGENVRDIAYIESQKLETQSTLFTLEEGTFYPHVSLYMLQLKVIDVSKAMNVISQIAKTHNQFDLLAEKYHQIAGYIDIEYTKTDLLIKLQSDVITALNPIRDGLRLNDQKRILTSTGVELTNLQEYGYRAIGQLFEPHLTLTRFENLEPIDTSTMIVPANYNGLYTHIGMFEMGENGTCIKPVGSFSFNA